MFEFEEMILANIDLIAVVILYIYIGVYVVILHSKTSDIILMNSRFEICIIRTTYIYKINYILPLHVMLHNV